MKHAYLIMAHNNMDILMKIVKLLDYKDNDIYIHVDKKCYDFNEKKISNYVKKSNIYFVKRLDVRWSCYSQIKCELELFKEASKMHYKYYHLISGADIPIKNQQEIHSFFNRYNKEFIHFRDHSSLGSRLDRIDYYHLFFKNARSTSKFKQKVSRKLHSICLKFQLKFGIHRVKKDCIENYRDGANWCSITHDLVEYIILNEKKIQKEYKYTYCADEIFLQSLVYNSKFYKSLYSYKNDDYKGIKRLIDWNRGQPYSFTKSDYKEIINSDAFFVRKVTDRELVDMIYNNLMNK